MFNLLLQLARLTLKGRIDTKNWSVALYFTLAQCSLISCGYCHLPREANASRDFETGFNRQEEQLSAQVNRQAEVAGDYLSRSLLPDIFSYALFKGKAISLEKTRFDQQ